MLYMGLTSQLGNRSSVSRSGNGTFRPKHHWGELLQDAKKRVFLGVSPGGSLSRCARSVGNWAIG